MTDAAVWILHAPAADTAGPLERWVAAERAVLAERHRHGFQRAGATSVRIVSGPPDDTPFGARLRQLVATHRPGGVVVLGSGSVPLATAADRRAFVDTAASNERHALTNNRYSSDIVAIGCAERLLDVPDLAGDNALPRWLEEVAGYTVAGRRRWRLAIDIDGPLDLVLTGKVAALAGAAKSAVDIDGAVAKGVTSPDVRYRTTPVGRDEISLDVALDRLAAVASVATDRRAELVLAGRTSASTLAWLERSIAARIRALVEERGLRASSSLAQSRAGGARTRTRPPVSVLGMVLDRDGPAALGERLGQLGDAAVVDTRVLLAHRLGPDEADWPSAEDRFASDLLLADRIHDRWLRDLTASAAAAPIPVVLGGHTLVGPGLRLVLASGT